MIIQMWLRQEKKNSFGEEISLKVVLYKSDLGKRIILKWRLKKWVVNSKL
jgi:hypothetical protein